MFRTPLRQPTLTASRRFINGFSSWLLRWADEAENEWVLFDRPAGSERDLAILADVMDATIVQRHPSNVVRIAGPVGVLRWEGLTWHHEVYRPDDSPGPSVELRLPVPPPLRVRKPSHLAAGSFAPGDVESVHETLSNLEHAD